MTRSLFLVALVATLAACSQQVARKTMMMEKVPAKAASAGAGRTLAYEHFLTIDADDQKVPAIFEAGQAACRQAVAEACVILSSRLDTGRESSASLKFRATPAGIRQLVAALSTQGEIASQSTTAEELAGPLEDSARKLAMLTEYRTKLEALLARAGNDVDALIKLNRELSQVQGELEAQAGTRAGLVQRVETETLAVTIAPNEHRGFWQPVGSALSEFATNLSRGISGAITGLAYLLPWVVVVLAAAWVGRKLWRRRRRAGERA